MKKSLPLGLLMPGALFFVWPATVPVAHAQVAPAQDVLPPEQAPPALTPVAPAKKRLTAIKIRNVPAGYIAYQLDPAHNPPPPGLQLAQLERDEKARAQPRAERIDLWAQWIQLDDEALARALPAWNALGASNWTRIVTPEERAALEGLNALNKIAPVTQRIFALDKSPSALAYLPLRPIIEPAPPMQPRAMAPAIKSQPKLDSLFADRPYIPNFAETMPMLSYMAPMPNGGTANTEEQESVPLTLELAPGTVYINPYVGVKPGGINEMQGAKFQLTPAINADKTITLNLRHLSAAPGADSTVQLGEGETAVFSLPAVTSTNAGQSSRTFLFVTPRVIPQSPTDSAKP